MSVVENSPGVYTFVMSEERKKEIALALLKQILTDEMDGHNCNLTLAEFCTPGRMMCIEWQSPGLHLDQPEALQFLDALRKDIEENRRQRSTRNNS